MNKTKSIAPKCSNCAEERKKADHSRKYAHELKNIFITISTVVNSEMDSPHPSFSFMTNNNNTNTNTNTNHVVDSGDVSPFIMEGRRQRFHSKKNGNNNHNHNDSPFYFLKALCDYGKTLIKEINDMGKDYVNNGDTIQPFNIAKAIDFCVDMFDTKRKYDKAKKHLEIYSDINFSYNKEIKSISETGFKMVLINLLTNSYKFTIKGKIVVRAVSIPKEKKIRILVKDSGKGFNPNEFIKNGCFYVYEKNQDLNADGSGLGLIIVNEILTKFKIKLDCISSAEKGGSLFYFDLDDTYPYYDEINPTNLMTDSLTKIINDINSGKKDNEFAPTKSFMDFQNNFFNANNNINEIDNRIENKTENKVENKNEINSSNNTSNKNLNNLNTSNNNLKISVNNHDDRRRFSFMNSNSDINSSPIINNSKNTDKRVSFKNFKNAVEKNSKNLNVNIYNLNNTTLFSFDKVSNKKIKSIVSNNDNNNNNNSNNQNSVLMATPNKKRIDKFPTLEKRKSMNKESSKIKKEGKSNILEQIIKDKQNFKKLKTFNLTAKKEKDIQTFKSKNISKKNVDEIINNLTEKVNEDEKNSEQKKKIKEDKKKNVKNYKKLLDSNFNKTNFYLFELRKIFLKNEIYIHLSQKKEKCLTEPSSSDKKSDKKLKKKKTFYNNNNKVYIIVCDDEQFVAISATELIKNYYIKKGKEPHIYYTPNGIECLYLMYKLSFIENRKIEYILMDLEMPFLNGIKTCNIIKSIKEANIRVFILSGDEPNDCLADGYCNKPLNEVDIVNKLDKEK